MGLANFVAGEVGNHRTAEDDAEPVGDPHHADGGEGFLKGAVRGDGEVGFGIDDVVTHGGAN